MKHTQKQIETIEKMLNKFNREFNRDSDYVFTLEHFDSDAKRYINACNSGRLMCNIESVSRSGMSRVMRFFELSKATNGRFYQQNFWSLFKILGYQSINNSDGFRINGCGMDMVFATNYNIIHDLHSLGYITKKTRDNLEQQTPHKV